MAERRAGAGGLKKAAGGPFAFRATKDILDPSWVDSGQPVCETRVTAPEGRGGGRRPAETRNACTTAAEVVGEGQTRRGPGKREESG